MSTPDAHHSFFVKCNCLFSGEVKARAIEILTEVVTHHQERRAAVTDADLETFMSVRPLMC